MEQALRCLYFDGKLSMEAYAQSYQFLKASTEYSDGELSPEQLLDLVQKGGAQLWMVQKGDEAIWVWITEIQERNGRKIAQVVAAGGHDLEAGWYFWPLMSKWMKGLDIQKAEVWCRPSMARLLKKRGLRTKYEVLDIEPEVI